MSSLGGLDRCLATRRLIVCVGPGGVGKTTMAAALGVRAARLGRRALVLTIDPARRLAAALGLDGLGDEEHSVALTGVAPLPGRSIRTLDAAMVDTKQSFDALITRVAPDDETRARILQNRAYRAFSRTMARSHAYVAMERLYFALEEDRYDVVILDTPPMRTALEILDAPGRLSRFLDERVLRWFLARGTKNPKREKSPALRLLEALTGGSVVEELVRFVLDLAPLREGFRDRAEHVRASLASPETAFVLVTAPEGSVLVDAGVLRDQLAARGVAVPALVVNRAYYPEPDDLAQPLAPPSAERLHAAGLPGALAAVRSRLARSNATLGAEIDAFTRHSPAPDARVRVPFSWTQVHHVAALAGLLDASSIA